MRTGIALSLSLGLILGPASTARSMVQEPDIQDVAGDANFLVTTLQRDTVTSPASYGAADLVSVDLQTTYDAVGVGDGIDYRPSALRVVFATSESPASLPPGGEIVFRVSSSLPSVHMEGIVTKSPEGLVMATARLRRGGLGCSAQPGQCWSHTRPEWTAQISDGQKTLTLTYPFSSLESEEEALIGVDALLHLPSAATVFSLGSASTDVIRERPIDIAPYGYGFVVGEDVPEDVACTEECERTELHWAAGFLWSDNNLDTMDFVGYINGAGKSPQEVHSVDVTLTITRCPGEGACTDTILTEHCEGLKCGIGKIIPYDPAETASYWFVFEWTFDDGDSWGFKTGKPCHDKLGLEECPDDSGMQVFRVLK